MADEGEEAPDDGNMPPLQPAKAAAATISVRIFFIALSNQVGKDFVPSYFAPLVPRRLWDQGPTWA